MNAFPVFVFTAALGCSCLSGSAQQPQSQPPAPQQQPAADKPRDDAEIQKLIDQLVFAHERASDTPLFSPGVKDHDDAEYKKQFKKCQEAFKKLTGLKEAAFPLLMKHLSDERPSIHFKNHIMEHSVGTACYWNLYFQLLDTPDDYSSYGFSRKGKDGKDHEKPSFNGNPFEQTAGLEDWLEKNKALTYTEKQIKCLTWLLEKEKAIGAPDAKSYFSNILPLEIRILERKLETGADVKQELERLRTVMKKKSAKDVPKEFLPDKSPPPASKKKSK